MEAKLKEFEDIIKANSCKSGEKQNSVVSVIENVTTSGASKPVPDYEKLKQESIEQQLIVREFFTARRADALFSGAKKKKKKNGEEEDVDGEQVTIIDENNIDETGEFDQNLIFKIKETNEEISRVFPTVDSKSQNKIRRTIFYEKLAKRLVLVFYKLKMIKILFV